MSDDALYEGTIIPHYLFQNNRNKLTAKRAHRMHTDTRQKCRYLCVLVSCSKNVQEAADTNVSPLSHIINKQN